MEQATYRVGPHAFEGANAEVLSATLEGGLLTRYLDSRVSAEELVAPMDTRRPPEERALPALTTMEKLAETTRAGGWIPLHRKLPDYEFANRFYSGYRDHSVHSLMVYVFGWYVYEYCSSIRSALLASLRARASDAADLTDVELFAEWWTITSIWHDWGYLFETEAFLTDPVLRERVLATLNDTLGHAPFAKRLTRLAGKPLREDELRSVYSAGGYYPLRVDNMDAVLTDADRKIVDAMFTRLGADPNSEGAVKAIIALTTQAPAGRPPYYDHGVCGALLLSKWWRETERFVTRLAAARDQDVAALLPPAKREEIALEVMSLEGVATLAIEAIAFHNLALKDWPGNELNRLLRPGTSLLRPGLEEETHLFFLSLCDTLQDWDRHHYTTSEPGRYRPATPSSQLLVQAVKDGILIGTPRGDAARSVRKLFENWLDEGTITKLLRDGASYTKKNVLTAVSTTTLEEAEISKTQRHSTELLLVAQLPALRKSLVEDTENGLHTAGVALDQLLDTVRRREQKLLPSEVKSLRQSKPVLELISLQKVAAALVRPGVKVSLGTIVDEIGAGGFGTVYTVQPTASASPLLAYKVFHAADLSLEKKRKMFRQGFDAMHRLRGHAGVVSVAEFSEFPFGFYMKFVAGPNLETAVASLGSIFDRLRILEQVADVLEYAHKRDVYHRDVKPSNVLLDPESGHPIITDFDLAWISGRSTISGTAYATMRYGAPEQFDDRLAALRTKPTVDIYSFGALSYFVLTEQEPIPGAVITADTEVVLRERMHHHLLAHLADSVVTLLSRCVSRDPSARPQDMWRVAAELRRVRMLSVKSQEVLSAGVFEREFFDAAGLAPEHGASAAGLTPSGRVRISLAARQRTSQGLDVVLTFELLGQASYNVISHDDYRTTVAKRIEKVLAKTEALGKFTRHSGGMNIWSIKGEEVPASKENAWLLAALARDVALTIE